jgi:hypothetical protein
MPGLDPGIHAYQHKPLFLITLLLWRVDGRVKHGHDGIGQKRPAGAFFRTLLSHASPNLRKSA